MSYNSEKVNTKLAIRAFFKDFMEIYFGLKTHVKIPEEKNFILTEPVKNPKKPTKKKILDTEEWIYINKEKAVLIDSSNKARMTLEMEAYYRFNREFMQNFQYNNDFKMPNFWFYPSEEIILRYTFYY